MQTDHEPTWHGSGLLPPPAASGVAAAAAGALLHGRYLVERHLGSGAFGSCWIATDVRSASKPLRVIKQVFVGTATEKASRSAEQEARLLAGLKHPHILRCFDAFVASGVFSIVTELCDDGDLALAIEQQRAPDGNGPHFPEQQVLDWVVQLALALQHIHERRILHRDVKSKNIFLSLTDSGERIVKLGDFGVARPLMDTAEQATSLAGTPMYMSPEVLQCHGYGPKADMWALGVVIYEVCLLRHPFVGQSLMGLLYKICEDALEVVLPADYSPALADLIRSLFDRDTRTRPSARELLAIPLVSKHAVEALERRSGVSPHSVLPKLPSQLPKLLPEVDSTGRHRQGFTPSSPHVPATRSDERVSLPSMRMHSSASPEERDGRMTSPVSQASPSPSAAAEPVLSPRERLLRRKEEQAAMRAKELADLAKQTAAENAKRFSEDRQRLHMGSMDGSLAHSMSSPWPPKRPVSAVASSGHDSGTSVGGRDSMADTPKDTAGARAKSAGAVNSAPGQREPVFDFPSLAPDSTVGSATWVGSSIKGPVWPPPSRDGPVARWAGDSTLGSTQSTLRPDATAQLAADLNRAAALISRRSRGVGASSSSNKATIRDEDATITSQYASNKASSRSVWPWAVSDANTDASGVAAHTLGHDDSPTDSPMMGSPNSEGGPAEGHKGIGGYDDERDNDDRHDQYDDDEQEEEEEYDDDNGSGDHATGVNDTTSRERTLASPSRSNDVSSPSTRIKALSPSGTGPVAPGSSPLPRTPITVRLSSVLGTPRRHGARKKAIPGQWPPPAEEESVDGGSDEECSYSDDWESVSDVSSSDDEVDTDAQLVQCLRGCLSASTKSAAARASAREAESWEEAAVGTRATQLERLERTARNALGDAKFDEVHAWLRSARAAHTNDADVQRHLLKNLARSPSEVDACFQVDQLVYLELFA